MREATGRGRVDGTQRPPRRGPAHRECCRSLPQLWPLTPIQSTQSSPGQQSSAECPPKSPWIGLHIHRRWSRSMPAASMSPQTCRYQPRSPGGTGPCRRPPPTRGTSHRSSRGRSAGTGAGRRGSRRSRPAGEGALERVVAVVGPVDPLEEVAVVFAGRGADRHVVRLGRRSRGQPAGRDQTPYGRRPAAEVEPLRHAPGARWAQGDERQRTAC